MVNDGLVANPDGASRPANEPAGYRVRSGFKPDYTIVSPNYSESRRAMAVKIGLGRQSGQKKPTKTEAGKSAARKRKADDAAE